ncbi:MAG: hypothetical protein IKQ69_00395 [Oscillospiraceae bacterium]|nr:hypothetical protein [Oscillospiraceae bacterium]
MQDVLTQTPVVLNIGLRLFSKDLERQDVEVAQVNWSPSPAFQKDRIIVDNAADLLDGLF